MRFPFSIEISGIDGISDPEGQTIERALPALGFSGIDQVHVGKVVRLVVDADDETSARSRVEELCDRLLVSPVIERSFVRLDPADPERDLDPADPERDLDPMGPVRSHP